MSTRKGKRVDKTRSSSPKVPDRATLEQVTATLAAEPLACYANVDWRVDGCTPLYVLRRGPDGRIAMAAFYIDVWCMGLREAFGQQSISLKDFARDMLKPLDENLCLARIEPAVARRLVAGGIAFARRNGFKLPAGFEEWTELLGELGDVAGSACSEFGVDGRLRYIGTREDLGSRLVDSSVEDFLDREDVEFIDIEDELALAEGPDAAGLVGEAAEMMGEALLSAARKWCFAQGVQPHPRLEEAVEVMLAAMIELSPTEEVDDLDEQAVERIRAHLQDKLQLRSPEDSRELEAASCQLMDFTAQFESPQAMFEAIGFGELLGDE